MLLENNEVSGGNFGIAVDVAFNRNVFGRNVEYFNCADYDRLDIGEEVAAFVALESGNDDIGAGFVKGNALSIAVTNLNVGNVLVNIRVAVFKTCFTVAVEVIKVALNYPSVVNLAGKLACAEGVVCPPTAVVNKCIADESGNVVNVGITVKTG